MKLSGTILLLFFGLSHGLNAQFSMEGYLSNAVSDSELQFFKERQDFVNENGIKSPILREVELRARVRSFDEGFSDYRLRFSPLNPFEKAANKDYRNEVNQQLSISYLLNLEEVLLGRYELMIRHWQLANTQLLISANIAFNENILTLLKTQSSSSTLKDFIRTDKAHFKNTLQYEALALEQAALEEQIKQTYSFDGDIRWEGVELIDIATIKEWLALAESRDFNNNLNIKNEQQKEAVAAAEYKIKRQESFSNIGYVQAEYREDDGNTFGQNMGMQIGVSIPVTNPDKPDLQRRKLEMLEDSQEFALEKQNLKIYLSQLYLKLETLLRQYELVEAKIDVYATNNFMAGSNSTSMDVVIELEEFRADLKLRKIDLSASIYKSYINLLSINSRLSQPPYTNYLSNDNASFDLEEELQDIR